MMYVGVSTCDLIFWSLQDVHELRWCPTIPPSNPQLPTILQSLLFTDKMNVPQVLCIYIIMGIDFILYSEYFKHIFKGKYM